MRRFDRAADIIRTERQTEIGSEIIEMLGLKAGSNGRVDTTWGDKTPLGLYLTLQRIMGEVK